MGQLVVHGSELSGVPQEAVMTQGVEGVWVVAVEVWLAVGHRGSSQAQPWALGSPCAGERRGSRSGSVMVHTPDKASDSIIGLHEQPRAMWREVRMVS